MKRVLAKALKYLAYCCAAVVILLAVAVGLFRLLLPRLPEYQEEIKEWANAAVGMQVEFSGMDARWRLSGPELTFYDARLVTEDDNRTVLNADEVSVGVGLLRLLLDLELVADRIMIRDATVEVLQQDDGDWLIQGLSFDDFLESRITSPGDAGPLAVVGEDIDVALQLAGRARPISIAVETLRFSRDEMQHGIDASLILPQALGARIDVAASQRLGDSATTYPWRFFVEGNALNLAGLSAAWPEDMPQFSAGHADVDLWLDVSADGIESATANFTSSGVVARGPAIDAGAEALEDTDAAIAAGGRIEFSRGADSWLLAADEFALTTANGAWPESTLQLRVNKEPPGDVDRVTGSATYLNLDDLRYIAGWLPEKYRSTFEELALSGVVRDLDVSVVGQGTLRRFNVSAVMERAGVAAYRGWPGIRGFSGSIRADQAGGRLEIDAVDMQLDLDALFAEPIDVDEAAGTVIWRRSDRGTTLLSDSIRIRNADFNSQSSLQVTLPAGGESPIVDLQSRWSVNDISIIERYLPIHAIKPGLYTWLRDALVAGQVPHATTRFSGALQQFPFDEGEGTFRVEARVENAVLRYAGKWPDVENIDLDLLIEKARLFSNSNSATSLGNSVVDARVEIPDLRSPVLSIDANATGTLASIRSFASQSPIAGLFGGHLERVAVEGDASFDLHLTYPILQRQNYAFETTIRTSNGALRVDGLPAPILAINGGVTVTRDEISAEALTGQFLGAPITIGLARADAGMPSRSVIATATGTVAATALIEELGAPLAGLLEGTTSYETTVRFPKAGQEDPVPLEILIESDLEGFAIKTPEPLRKAASTRRALSLTIAFPGEGRIESFGSLSEDVRWTVGFAETSRGWDFDRGVLSLGGAAPGEPGTRGLHIEGTTPVVNFDDWLDLASAEGDGPGFGDRIRSVDLVVDDLHVIGQHLARHRVIVNRSAFDWVVQIDGADAIGTITVPYDFAASRPLVLDMQKLTLPGGDEGSTQVDQLADPRKLPQITVRADEFSLGERHLGSLQAEFLQTNAGLEASAIETQSASFGIIGSAGWIVDESMSTGQRSYVTGVMTSTNVQKTMQQLDYQPGIEGEDMHVQFDVSWSGGPKQDFLGSLDGSVGVRFGSGQLNEVEPGAGRVFGLMSIVALPRRLSLDFSDVFERGFGFDEITGNFRVENGQAYTCDLSLTGPAADVGIVGRTGLVDKVYDQAAVVSSNVGNTLPVVGAVVAGPQVAAALWIFSQIFKKPLQEMGQIYYGIEGTWEDPLVDVVDARDFAETSRMAGCLESSE